MPAKSTITFADFAEAYERGDRMQDIAKRLNCAESLLRRIMTAAGVPKRPRGRPFVWGSEGDGSGFQCQSCGSVRIGVDRVVAHRGSARRERECQRCHATFFTIELRCTPQGDPLP